MAAATNSDKQRTGDLTECSICTEEFTQPVDLPCVHTFCQDCFTNYGRDKGPGDTVRCPLCRQEFVVPDGGVIELLAKNIFIEKLVEINKVASRGSLDMPTSISEPCDICNFEETTNEKAISEWRCLNCGESLCNRCREIHRRQRATRSHKLVEVDKCHLEYLSGSRPSFCDEHKDNILELFCTKCKSPICIVCLKEKHDTHKCSSIERVFEESQQLLKTDIDMLKEKIVRCKEETSRCERVKSLFINSVDAARNLMIAISDQQKHLIDKHTNSLIEELGSMHLKTVKEIEVTKLEVERQLLMCETLRRYSQEIIDKATPTDMWRVAESVHSRAAELDANEIPGLDYLSANVAFSPECIPHEYLDDTTNLIGTVAVHHYFTGKERYFAIMVLL